MKLYIPFKQWWITQHFGQNGNTYYSEAGLAGHTGVDIAGMGTDHTIYAATDSYVFSHQNRDNPDLMRYRAVYTLIEDSGIFYELSYGHVSDIYAEIGTSLKRGDRIALESNTGDVASNGKKITLQEKLNGSNAGRHLHLQLRLVEPVEKRKSGKVYLKDGNGYFKKDGMYFERQDIPAYADCTDLLPFLVYESAVAAPPPAPVEEKVTITLRYGDGTKNGKTGQVKILQKKLGGLLVDGEYGVKTKAKVIALQKTHNLVQDGIFGPKTNAVLFTT